jgi:hypothetical protein
MKRIAHSARLPSIALVVALASVAAPSPAHADEEGRPGRVVQLRLNNPSSDAHPSYHGSVILELVGSTTQVEYRWGGSSCPAQTLSEAQIGVLVTAFVQRRTTKVAPVFTMGEGLGTRCLVGFSIVAG